MTSLTTDLRITSCFLIHLNGGWDQFYRPLKMNANASLTNDFLLATNDGKNISKQSLSDLANEYINVSPETGPKVDIPNGWDSNRLAFMIKLEVHGSFGKREETYYGFTSYYGISVDVNSSYYGGDPRIDPQMLFYFNAIDEVSFLSRVTPQHGIIDTPIPNKSLNILGNTHTDRALYTMRPQDMFHLRQTEAVVNQFGSSLVKDLRFTEKQTSARDLTNPTNLLTDVVNGLLIGDAKMRDLISEPDIDVYALAMNANQEVSLNRLKFYEKINKGNYGIHRTDGFSWATLVGIFPELNDTRTVHFMLPKQGSNRLTLIDTRDTEHFKGSTLETILISSIANVLPSIMTKYIVIAFDFFIDRYRASIDGNGTPPHSLKGQPLTSMFREAPMNLTTMMAFQNELLQEIHFNLMAHKVSSYSLDMQISLSGISEIRLSINGGPSVPYHVPFYGNSYTSPLVTTDPNDGINFCKNVELVLENTGLYSGSSTYDYESMLRSQEYYDGRSNMDDQQMYNQEFQFVNEGFIDDDIPGWDDEMTETINR